MFILTLSTVGFSVLEFRGIWVGGAPSVKDRVNVQLEFRRRRSRRSPIRGILAASMGGAGAFDMTSLSIALIILHSRFAPPGRGPNRPPTPTQECWNRDPRAKENLAS